MRVETLLFGPEPEAQPPFVLTDADLVFFFVSPDYPQKKELLAKLKSCYPAAALIGCTTGGEILGEDVLRGSAVTAALKLEKCRVRAASAKVEAVDLSYQAGRDIAAQLAGEDLRWVFVLSDGLKTNGSALVKGIVDNLPPDVILTGGLAADEDRFVSTGVGLDEVPVGAQAVAVGLYGKDLRVSYGSVGGWVKFGPKRLITKARGNVLYELDGQGALGLYRKYVGDETANIVNESLLYPLGVTPADNKTHEIVRTFLSINPDNSLNFAGDVPEGFHAQLMRAGFDNLVDGAERAAMLARDGMSVPCTPANSLALLVSCLGRRILMDQHISDELEAVRHILPHTSRVGFYSYGEICPHEQTNRCDLHNQTMTITLLAET